MSALTELKEGLTIAEVIRIVSQSFKLADVETPEVDARLLIGHALRLGRAQLILQSDSLVDASNIDAISALATRRIAHEPVARILGRKEFWSLELRVTPAVLVPRPDTETVVEAVLDRAAVSGLRMEKLRLLDIGTGSGAILLALLSELHNATGIGTDISDKALEVARRNARWHHLDARARFVACDCAQAVRGPFDFVVSNPPYIASSQIRTLSPDVRDYDPGLALNGGDDGLAFYRVIAADAVRLLAAGGHVVVEIGAGQEASVTTILTEAGLRVASTRKDLAGIPRALEARLQP